MRSVRRAPPARACHSPAWLAAAACLLALASAATGTAPAAAKLNILLIVADDLGYNDVEFHRDNTSVVRTPYLNELARYSVVLTNHHVQPFCSPTRAAIQTGRHVLRYGLSNSVIWPEDAYAVPENETFISQNLQEAGYHTGAFGKWHLGLFKNWTLPMKRGYHEQYGYYLGGEEYWTHVRNGGLDWHRNESLETNDNGTYSASLLGDAAVSFISEHSNKPLPWFLYLPFQSVHSPMEAPQNCLDRYPNLSGNMKTRAAMVTALDDQIGRITQQLIDSDAWDNTIIVFTADNGAPYGDAFEAVPTLGKDQPQRPPVAHNGPGGGSNSPLIGWKHWVFEGGVRSAAFFYHPHLKNPGTEHAGLFHAVDWLPTLVNLARGNTSRNLPLDGFDIFDAIQEGGRASPRTEIPVNIAACPHAPTIVDGPQAAMIVGDLKVIASCWWRHHKDRDSLQLFNITADPTEQHDLSKSHPEDLAKVVKRLDYWEAQATPPYAVDPSCGEGKPFGDPPRWDTWC